MLGAHVNDERRCIALLGEQHIAGANAAAHFAAHLVQRQVAQVALKEHIEVVSCMPEEEINNKIKNGSGKSGIMKCVQERFSN